MNLFTFIAVSSISFSLGVIFMAYWVYISQQNKVLENEAMKHFKSSNVSYQNRSLLNRCKRCGSNFNIASTEDENLELCQDCMKHLRANPDDYFFKSW